MTGHNKGCIRVIQEFFERPLQWRICLLHCNELSLHVMFSLIMMARPKDQIVPAVKLENKIVGPVSKRNVKQFSPTPNDDFPLLPANC